MKILSIADKEGSAIDRLAKMNLRRFKHYQAAHICVHPKRPSETEINLARALIKQADIVSCEYWKTACMLYKAIPEMRNKKLVLTHNNEHNIEGDWDWKNIRWDAHVAKNKWQFNKLVEQGLKPILIRHAIEFENFRYKPELTDEKIVIYVGQIKKVKGVREIKKACDELGYRLLIVGGVSEAGYWQEFDKNNLLIHQNVPDESLCDIYHQARVFVCNSDDGTESGTLPILEAMAAGIPVLTRKIGHVRDMGKHMGNMIIRDGKYTDIDDLKANLQLLMEDDNLANELRENAWRTVRQYHPEVQAREYDRLFRQVMYPDSKSVSVIIPTYNRAEVVAEQLASLEQQTYKNFEAVICDDGSTDNTENVVKEARKLYDYPIRYVQTGNKPDPAGDKKYGLAQARNMGLIEAIGDIVVLCDDRLKMHPEAIANFVKKLETSEDPKKTWVWGTKSGKFKTFVENFSATYRRTVIIGGMFNERIDEYGGMTQEVSNRFASQGVKFVYAPEALAEPMMGTHSKSHHREEIIRSKIKLYKMGFQ